MCCLNCRNTYALEWLWTVIVEKFQSLQRRRKQVKTKWYEYHFQMFWYRRGRRKWPGRSTTIVHDMTTALQLSETVDILGICEESQNHWLCTAGFQSFKVDYIAFFLWRFPSLNILQSGCYEKKSRKFNSISAKFHWTIRCVW